MAIVKYPRGTTPRFSPWGDVDWFANRMNRMFGDWDQDELTYGWVPSVNVEEREDEILLTAELPGMAEDDVDVELENNVLTISGKKHEEKEEGEKGGKFHLVERTFGSFRRSFTLPRTVDAESIEARYEDGLLTVHMPKAAEAKSRKIKVSQKA